VYNHSHGIHNELVARKEQFIKISFFWKNASFKATVAGCNRFRSSAFHFDGDSFERPARQPVSLKNSKNLRLA